MSAAAQTALTPRKVVKGWSQIPNSLIENCGTLTHAELVLSMIVLRADASAGPIMVTEDKWSRWTGLNRRTLEYAVAGLSKKGVLKVQGRGMQARYEFDRRNWEVYVSTVAPAERPKTEGRKAVKPVAAKPGAMVHPDCSGECALIRQDREEVKAGSLHLVPPPAPLPNAQRVAQTPRDSQAPRDARRVNPPVATPIPQPVAQIDQAALAYPKALETLQSLFPWVETPFLVQLVGNVRAAKFTDVTDAELAEAIQHAYKRKGRVQQSEGLFLLTVPESLAAIRRRPKVDTAKAAADQFASHREGILQMLRRTHGVLDALGQPFTRAAVKVRSLAGRVEAQDANMLDLEALDQDMEAIEREVIGYAVGALDDQQRVECEQMVERCLKPYVGKFTAKQLADMRENAFSRGALNAMGIPRLGSLYV